MGARRSVAGALRWFLAAAYELSVGITGKHRSERSQSLPFYPK
jgi:hypothetical protein